MNPMRAVAFLAAVGLAGALAVWWWDSGVRTDAPATTTFDAAGTLSDRGGGSAVAPVGADPARVARDAGTPTTETGTEARAATRRPRADDAGGDPMLTWPIVRSASGSDSRAAPTDDPAVTVELAFLALRFVGIDAEAERTWRRAIDDPNTPAGARSDLIEDLNQEGYTDNSHPTSEDLQLILARLELIERLAPHAVDEVNAAAFEEAYKDLLAMYVRLAGHPPGDR